MNALCTWISLEAPPQQRRECGLPKDHDGMHSWEVGDEDLSAEKRAPVRDEAVPRREAPTPVKEDEAGDLGPFGRRLCPVEPICDECGHTEDVCNQSHGEEGVTECAGWVRRIRGVPRSAGSEAVQPSHSEEARDALMRIAKAASAAHRWVTKNGHLGNHGHNRPGTACVECRTLNEIQESLAAWGALPEESPGPSCPGVEDDEHALTNPSEACVAPPVEGAPRGSKAGPRTGEEQGR